MTAVVFSAISAPGNRDRINEDGWAAVEAPKPPGWFSTAVIDGASVRAMLPSLANYVEKQGYGARLAAWATSVVRGALYQTFTGQPAVPPRDALLAANRALRAALEAVPGMTEIYSLLECQPVKPLLDGLAHCTASLASELRQVFESLFPDGGWHQLDTRYLRLVLPACVATLIRLDLSSRIFDFAHVGDTALALVGGAEEINMLSQDQMGTFDEEVIEIGLRAVRQRDEIHSVAEAVQKVPEIRELNLLNGLHHNYLDREGHPQPSEGCGVLNGLSSLSNYVQTGKQALPPATLLYLMSDGMMLPLSRPSASLPPSIRDSVATWRRALQEGDVASILRCVRNIAEADASKDIFPRLKQHDDATALMITVQT